MKLLKVSYKKKAVTPVIATVLLIAITIVLFLIIFLFGRGFIKEALQKQDKPVEQICDLISLESSYHNGKLVIINNGNIPVYGFNVQVREGRRTKNYLFEVSENEENLLRIGDLRILDIEGIPERVYIFPIILGENEKGDYNEYTCKNAFNAEIKN